MAQWGTILGVWAHPDDEAFCMSGIMASAVRDGDSVTCVTATRGEGGSPDHDRYPPERMGEVREAEMLRCMEILGVQDHRFLDYIDGTMHEQEDEPGIALVESVLRETEPDTVLTFGPDGQTGHKDHQTISRWTTIAFDRAAKPTAQLHYMASTPEWGAVMLPILAPFNIFAPGYPPLTPRDALSIDFILDDALLDLKVEGLLAHASQIEGLVAALGLDSLRAFVNEETFRRYVPSAS